MDKDYSLPLEERKKEEVKQAEDEEAKEREEEEQTTQIPVLFLLSGKDGKFFAVGAPSPSFPDRRNFSV